MFQLKLRATGCHTTWFFVGEPPPGFPQRAAEDINVDGDRQPFLPLYDPVDGVNWDLNYLHAKENVRFRQV